ncbi:MAG: Hsp33 family molecular chaperone HslO [Alphaproteobacteria bacterium]|nr:Hsp33 family molecular chaperone HslO [Alphaproteobacteria bacterium]
MDSDQELMPADIPGGTEDVIQPFRVESFSLRGRLVRLGPAVQEILSRHAYPDEVASLLGEALVLATLLSAALKFEGVFNLQARGDGPVSLMVADVTSEGGLRGYAQFDADRLAALGPSTGNPVPRLLGAGYLAFTVDQGADTERYQGIVELTGGSIAECAHHYFRQSEQLEAAIHVAAGRDPEDAWRAGGLMIQRLPGDGGSGKSGDAEEAEEGWRRALVLMASARADELLDPDLTPRRLLYRLFHEEGVRAYRPRPVAARCRCSAERVERTLVAMPRSQVDDLKEDGEVVVTCQFCNATYRFDQVALDRLFGAA